MENVEDFIRKRVDNEISTIRSATHETDELDEIPEHAWPTDHIVENYMYYIRGSVWSSIEWLVVITAEEHDEIDIEKADTTRWKRLANTIIENRREDLVNALEK